MHLLYNVRSWTSLSAGHLGGKDANLWFSRLILIDTNFFEIILPFHSVKPCLETRALVLNNHPYIESESLPKDIFHSFRIDLIFLFSMK